MPKSQLLTEAKTPCITCGRECPDGLRYCLYCGGKTLEIDKPVMPMNPHCPECGEEDPLNITFCVACGAKLLSAIETTVTAARFRRKTGFNWTVEVTPPPSVRSAVEVARQPDKPVIVRTKVRPTGVVPVAAGIAGGLLLTGALYASGWLPLMFDRATWPKSGLVVYCPVNDSSLPSTESSSGTGIKDLGVDSGKTGASAPDDSRESPNPATKGALKNGPSGGAGDASEAGDTGAGSSTGTEGDTASKNGADTASKNPAESSIKSPADDATNTSADKANETATETVAKAGTDTANGTAADTSSLPGAGATNANTSTAAAESSSSDSTSSASPGKGAAAGNTAAAQAANSGLAQGTSGMQISLENLQTHQLVVGPVMPPRRALGMKMPGCLIMKDLPAGEYMMRIGRAGDTAAFGRVTLVGDKPTVIGYPQGIRLPI